MGLAKEDHDHVPARARPPAAARRCSFSCCVVEFGCAAGSAPAGASSDHSIERVGGKGVDRTEWTRRCTPQARHACRRVRVPPKLTASTGRGRTDARRQVGARSTPARRGTPPHRSRRGGAPPPGRPSMSHVLRAPARVPAGLRKQAAHQIGACLWPTAPVTATSPCSLFGSWVLLGLQTYTRVRLAARLQFLDPERKSSSPQKMCPQIAWTGSGRGNTECGTVRPIVAGAGEEAPVALPGAGGRPRAWDGPRGMAEGVRARSRRRCCRKLEDDGVEQEAASADSSRPPLPLPPPGFLPANLSQQIPEHAAAVDGSNASLGVFKSPRCGSSKCTVLPTATGWRVVGRHRRKRCELQIETRHLLIAYT